MRRSSLPQSLLMLLSLLLCGGCASRIYDRGRYREVLARGMKRAEIRAALGTPVKSGKDEEPDRGGEFDEFKVRGPIYDGNRSAGAAIVGGMTLGISEVITTPQALWWRVSESGYKRIRVFYSQDLVYRSHMVMGEKNR